MTTTTRSARSPVEVELRNLFGVHLVALVMRTPRARLRSVVGALVVSILAVGCSQPTTPAGEVTPTAATIFASRDDATASLDNAVLRARETIESEGAQGPYSGDRLSVPPGVEDADLVSDVQRQLGDGWTRLDISSGRTTVNIYGWRAGKQFYVLITSDEVLEATDGTRYRPLRVLHTE